MKIDNPIPVIRALWGEREETLQEIPKSPIFVNETVFVWGLKNKKYLEELGYRTVLVKDNLKASTDISVYSKEIQLEILEEHLQIYTADHRYSSPYLHFTHKLEALRLADKIYGEYLFLDWDITLAKSIDSQFFDNIRQKGNFQCPVYAYNDEWLNEILKLLPADENNVAEDVLIVQDKLITEFSWKLNNLRVCPCACFIYCNNVNYGQKLLDIVDKYKLKSVVDEFSMFILLNCSLEEYIQKYDPIVINGKEIERRSQTITEAFEEVNSYVALKNKKDIYLYHDL